MSAAYKIERWDAVMFGNYLRKIPMIYIKPDETFLEFARNNNFSVLCEISDTGMNYDTKSGNKIPGIINQSGSIPNCRPNFFEKTGLYVISLLSPWIGYPSKNSLGTVKFFGLDKGIKKQIPTPFPSKVKKSLIKNEGPGSVTQKNSNIILIITLGSAIVLALICAMYLLLK